MEHDHLFAVLESDDVQPYFNRWELTFTNSLLAQYYAGRKLSARQVSKLEDIVARLKERVWRQSRA